jgi:hypothetical protein
MMCNRQNPIVSQENPLRASGFEVHIDGERRQQDCVGKRAQRRGDPGGLSSRDLMSLSEMPSMLSPPPIFGGVWTSGADPISPHFVTL